MQKKRMERGFEREGVGIFEFLYPPLQIYGILFNRKTMADRNGGIREGNCGGMKLIEHLFVGENVTELETILYSLRRSIPVLHLYCIVYFEDKERLEILSSYELFQDRNRERQGMIAGVAMGRKEAIDLLVYMAEEARRQGRNPGDPKDLIG